MATIMTVRVPDELQEQLKNKAKDRGLTRNALVLQILWEWAKKHAGGEPEERR